MANNKWIVVQNQQGQQFPIAMQGVAQFLIRWPTTPNALTPSSLVEAIGEDVGSNTLRHRAHRRLRGAGAIAGHPDPPEPPRQQQSAGHHDRPGL